MMRKKGVYELDRVVEEWKKAFQEFMEEMEREGVFDMPRGIERVIKANKIYMKYWPRLAPLTYYILALLERGRRE